MSVAAKPICGVRLSDRRRRVSPIPIRRPADRISSPSGRRTASWPREVAARYGSETQRRSRHAMAVAVATTARWGGWFERVRHVSRGRPRRPTQFHPLATEPWRGPMWQARHGPDHAGNPSRRSRMRALA